MCMSEGGVCIIYRVACIRPGGFFPSHFFYVY